MLKCQQCFLANQSSPVHSSVSHNPKMRWPMRSSSKTTKGSTMGTLHSTPHNFTHNYNLGWNNKDYKTFFQDQAKDQVINEDLNHLSCQLILVSSNAYSQTVTINQTSWGNPALVVLSIASDLNLTIPFFSINLTEKRKGRKFGD